MKERGQATRRGAPAPVPPKFWRPWLRRGWNAAEQFGQHFHRANPSGHVKFIVNHGGEESAGPELRATGIQRARDQASSGCGALRTVSRSLLAGRRGAGLAVADIGNPVDGPRASVGRRSK